MTAASRVGWARVMRDSMSRDDGVIRHPMYASQWLWVIAQPLLLQNWAAGFINLIIFIPFYLLRVQAEEQMMVDKFGEQYKTYMGCTGRVLPKIG